MAAIYGAVPVTDTRLLATAALLRSQWADPSSPDYYPINGADQERGIGPMLGRYPGDTYDGDTADAPTRDTRRSFASRSASPMLAACERSGLAFCSSWRRMA